MRLNFLVDQLSLCHLEVSIDEIVFAPLAFFQVPPKKVVGMSISLSWENLVLKKAKFPLSSNRFFNRSLLSVM